MIDEDRPVSPAVLKADTRPEHVRKERFTGNGRGLMIGVLATVGIVVLACVVTISALVWQGIGAARKAIVERAATDRQAARQVADAVRRDARSTRSGQPANAAERMPTDNPAAWITADDYPAEALRNNEEGTVSITWVVGSDGRVSDCAATTSSGHASLDRAACAAIMRNGRYVAVPPATPPRIFTRRVVWKIPA